MVRLTPAQPIGRRGVEVERGVALLAAVAHVVQQVGAAARDSRAGLAGVLNAAKASTAFARLSCSVRFPTSRSIAPIICALTGAAVTSHIVIASRQPFAFFAPIAVGLVVQQALARRPRRCKLCTLVACGAHAGASVETGVLEAALQWGACNTVVAISLKVRLALALVADFLEVRRIIASFTLVRAHVIVVVRLAPNHWSALSAHIIFVLRAGRANALPIYQCITQFSVTCRALLIRAHTGSRRDASRHPAAFNTSVPIIAWPMTILAHALRAIPVQPEVVRACKASAGALTTSVYSAVLNRWALSARVRDLRFVKFVICLALCTGAHIVRNKGVAIFNRAGASITLRHIIVQRASLITSCNSRPHPHRASCAKRNKIALVLTERR